MSLRARAVTGVKATGSASAAIAVLDFVRLAVLAHLLEPADFGLMGMILVVIGFSQTFADAGVSSAVIHRQDTTRDQLSSLYWVTLASGIVMFAAIAGASPWIAAFFGQAALRHLLPLAAAVLLILPAGQLFHTQLQKQLRFRTLAAVDTAAALVTLGVSIASGLAGQGVFALVWGSLAHASTRSLCWVAIASRRWRPGLHFRLRDLRNYAGFGLYQMGARLLNYWGTNVDYLLIGWALGPESLGYYTLALGLVVRPMVRINPVLTQVAFPIFSRRQTDDPALKYGYLQMIKLLSVIIFPILIGVGVLAPLLVPLIYGAGWETSIVLVQIFATLGMVKAVSNPSGAILYGKGRADIAFRLDLLLATLNSIVFLGAVRYGVFGVAWCWLGLSLVHVAISRRVLENLIDLRWKDFVAQIQRPTLAGLAMGITVGVAYQTLPIAVVGARGAALFLVAVGAAVYTGLLIWIDADYFRDLRSWVLPSRAPRHAATGGPAASHSVAAGADE